MLLCDALGAATVADTSPGRRGHRRGRPVVDSHGRHHGHGRLPCHSRPPRHSRTHATETTPHRSRRARDRDRHRTGPRNRAGPSSTCSGSARTSARSFARQRSYSLGSTAPRLSLCMATGSWCSGCRSIPPGRSIARSWRHRRREDRAHRTDRSFSVLQRQRLPRGNRSAPADSGVRRHGACQIWCTGPVGARRGDVCLPGSVPHEPGRGRPGRRLRPVGSSVAGGEGAPGTPGWCWWVRSRSWPRAVTRPSDRHRPGRGAFGSVRTSRCRGAGRSRTTSCRSRCACFTWNTSHGHGPTTVCQLHRGELDGRRAVRQVADVGPQPVGDHWRVGLPPHHRVLGVADPTAQARAAVDAGEQVAARRVHAGGPRRPRGPQRPHEGHTRGVRA
ncbi:hypothetical protein JOF36_000540 [Pseudonocardia parietis]|uniref:Uncharacterized protein n=1 Tax=Pseudonocardia parietis TaxID=570936 RepID=A0ABS4VLP6_9PSEU|nr:hypothetical protein [Pseudonocardia parietis]